MSQPGSPAIAPLRFAPILKAKVWGGRRLERWGKALPPGTEIGESWEIADLDATDPGGGGGQAAHSRVRGGPWSGRAIREVLGAFPREMMGACPLSAGGAFPLLVKFLDARQHLSVQVHPSPAYAAAHPEAHLKTESWLVLEAEPVQGEPARIFKGLRPGVGPRELREAIEHGRVPEVIHAVEAIPGECHTLPSGTVHALGAGVLVAEVQTASDTTFRVYDWAREYGRQGRALHVVQALANVAYEPAPGARRAPVEGGLIAETEFYTMRVASGGVEFAGSRPAPVIVMGLEGEGTGPNEVGRGETVMVPAACAVRLRFERALVIELMSRANRGRRPD